MSAARRHTQAKPPAGGLYQTLLAAPPAVQRQLFATAAWEDGLVLTNWDARGRFFVYVPMRATAQTRSWLAQIRRRMKDSNPADK